MSNSNKAYNFTVEYPWGSNFVNELQEALDDMGYRTHEDNMLKDSGEFGFYFSKLPQNIERVQALETCISTCDDQAQRERYARELGDVVCRFDREMGHVAQPWKELDLHYMQQYLDKYDLHLAWESVGSGMSEAHHVTISCKK